MKQKILNLLKERILEVEKYAIAEKKLQDLNKERKLNDIEEYGVTSSLKHFERLFVLHNGKLEEKDIAHHKIRKKHYGKDRISEEAGAPLKNYLDGKEEAVIIVSSLFDTRPKGPHHFQKDLEVYVK